MKPKQKRKRFISLFFVALLLVGGGVWKIASTQNNQEDGAITREREYTATISDIIVGINVAGKTQSTPVDIKGIEGLVIENYFVDVGSPVTRGDKLAKYTQASLDKALSAAFEAYQQGREGLEKARNNQLSGLLAINSRLKNDKKLNQNIYSAYTKGLNSLLNGLTDSGKEIAEQVKANPDSKEWAAKAKANEEELAAVKKLIEEGKASREIQKAQEEDLPSQTEADLMEMALLEEQVLMAQRNLTTKGEELLHLQGLQKDPFLFADEKGVITKVHVNPGEEIPTGEGVLALATQERWTFTFKVDQGDIASIAQEQDVNLVVNAYPTDPLKGLVSQIKYVAEDDGKYVVTVEVSPPSFKLLEGMEAYGTVILAKKEAVLTLSNKAIYQKEGLQYVKVRSEAGELVEKQIITGFSDGKVSEIVEGLAPGDLVIVVDIL